MVLREHSPHHPLPQLVLRDGMKPPPWPRDLCGAATRWGSRCRTPSTPRPPSAEVPSSCPEAQANRPGCTCRVGSTGPIDAVDACNQLECPGARWDKHTLSITRWPGPVQRQRRGALPGPACLGPHQPGEQRYPGLPFAGILPKSRLGLGGPCRTPAPQAGALITCQVLGADPHVPPSDTPSSLFPLAAIRAQLLSVPRAGFPSTVVVRWRVSRPSDCSHPAGAAAREPLPPHSRGDA